MTLLAHSLHSACTALAQRFHTVCTWFLGLRDRDTDGHACLPFFQPSVLDSSHALMRSPLASTRGGKTITDLRSPRRPAVSMYSFVGERARKAPAPPPKGGGAGEAVPPPPVHRTRPPDRSHRPLPPKRRKGAAPDDWH